jgi:hypothetical protein
MSAERDPAIARFAVLQLVRLSGTLLVLAGALVASRKVGWLSGLPEAAGYVLMAAGLADFFALPPAGEALAEFRMKRFYKTTVVAEEGGFRVALDGRASGPLAAAPDRPSRALAEAMAAEWADQGEEIDSTRFLRDMADFALDVVAPNAPARLANCCLMPKPIRCAIAPSRTSPGGAPARGVGTAAVRHGNAHRRQLPPRFGRDAPAAAPEAIERIAGELEGLDAFALAALRNTASLAASLTLGLAAIAPGADVKRCGTRPISRKTGRRNCGARMPRRRTGATSASPHSARRPASRNWRAARTFSARSAEPVDHVLRHRVGRLVQRRPHLARFRRDARHVLFETLRLDLAAGQFLHRIETDDDAPAARHSPGRECGPKGAAR